jgi:hypothetical protein
MCQVVGLGVWGLPVDNRAWTFLGTDCEAVMFAVCLRLGAPWSCAVRWMRNAMSRGRCSRGSFELTPASCRLPPPHTHPFSPLQSSG